MKAFRGFTLVELMVALALGILLSLAAIQLFATNQRTFTLQEVVSGLQEDGQSVIRYITADILSAGRGTTLLGNINPVVVASSTNGSNGGNDQLVVTYFGTSDCQGTVPGGEVEIINTYFVSAAGELTCSGNLTAGNVVLLPGIESFQVLYGLDTDPNSALGVNRYVAADSLNADSVVVAIRLALLLRSSQEVSVADSSQTYYVLDESIDSPSDRLIRRVFTTTVQLRNYDWDGV
jgi:type IV pilus assembly protein PilW